MNESLFVVGLIIVAWAYLKFKSNTYDKQIIELEQKKAADQAQVDQLKTEASNLKETITKEQKNATEEQKNDFWKNYTNNSDK